MSVAIAPNIPSSHYNPSTGRFLSPDPIGLAGGDTNLCRYVENNPILYTDPFGLVKVKKGIDDSKLDASLSGQYNPHPSLLFLFQFCYTCVLNLL